MAGVEFNFCSLSRDMPHFVYFVRSPIDRAKLITWLRLLERLRGRQMEERELRKFAEIG